MAIVGKQLSVDGQLGDKAVVEVGQGTVYIGGRNELGEYTTAAMLSPTQARLYAAAIVDAADECEHG